MGGTVAGHALTGVVITPRSGVKAAGQGIPDDLRPVVGALDFDTLVIAVVDAGEIRRDLVEMGVGIDARPLGAGGEDLEAPVVIQICEGVKPGRGIGVVEGPELPVLFQQLSLCIRGEPRLHRRGGGRGGNFRGGRG